MGRAKTIRLDVKLKLLNDYHHNDDDTVAILAERYSMHPNTVMRIIRNESLLLGKKSLATTDEEEHGKNETGNVDQQTTTLERSKQRKRRKFSKSNDSNQRKDSINGESNASTNQQQQSLSKRNDSENSEIDETERIMAMKRFFDYVDRIEDIILRYDYDYNHAFQFTRDLNQSTLHYRHMLYEMEKRQLIRTNRWNNIDHSNLQSSSSSSNHNGQQQQGLDDDNSKDISKKFRDLIRNGIARAT